jgi:hypothetical protein
MQQKSKPPKSSSRGKFGKENEEIHNVKGTLGGLDKSVTPEPQIINN